MNPILRFSLVLVIVLSAYGQIDETLCRFYKYTKEISTEHITCETDSFKGSCIGGKIENLTGYELFIMDHHNYYRDIIASGHLPGYRPAVRMLAVWDWYEDMVQYATFAAKQCKEAIRYRAYDFRYKEASANVYMVQNEDAEYSIEEVIRDALMRWFDEYENCPSSEISYFTPKFEKQCHNFHRMVCDRILRMACSMVTNIAGGKRTTVFVCVYSAMVKPMTKSALTGEMFLYTKYNYTSKVYLEGPAASYCQTRHPHYHGLCTGEIDDGYTWSSGQPTYYGPSTKKGPKEATKYDFEENGAAHYKATFGAVLLLLRAIIISRL